MKISDVRVSGKPLVLAKPADVSALESQLWIAFPNGYLEYVTKLGEGVLGGELVRIYPPWRIEKELSEWRRRINKYWFWDKGRKLLPKERAVECLIIGDTVNGDELVFHPTHPNQLFVLPGNSEKIFDAGTDLLAAVEWMCSSGKLVKAFSDRNFTPFDSRKEAAERGRGQTKEADPEGESLDDLVALAKQWAKRHGARKLAQRDLKGNLPEMLGELPKQNEETKSTLVYEALVMEGEYPYEASYLVIFRINDKKSGLELGQFSWHMEDGSSGYQFAPNEAILAKVRKVK